MNTTDEEAIYNEGYRAGYMAGYQDVLMSGIYAQHEAPRNVDMNTGGETSSTWTLDEIRQEIHHIDALRTRGLIPPLKRYVEIDYIKKDKSGKYYIASDEQLQDELAVQGRSAIDSNGNLVVDGKIVTYGWLASFDK